MLRSMTACGRAQKCEDGVDLSLEIVSHNKRALDVAVRLPHELSFLDSLIRKQVQEEVERGSIAISLSAVFHDSIPYEVELQSALIEKVKKAAPGISLELLLPIVAREFPLIQMRLSPDAEKKFEKQVCALLKAALEQFQEMRDREGALIAKEFEERLKTIESLSASIQQLSGNTEERYRIKLQKRLEVLFPDIAHDERVAKEIAILAEKLDVSEEISRLQMHVNGFRQALQEKKSAGKKLEFIVQELLREFNTIGSKAQDGAITEYVIQGKCEVEKIREQVMNVE